MDHIATDPKLVVSPVDTSEKVTRKAKAALQLNAKEDGILSDFPVRVVLKDVLDVKPVVAEQLASQLYHEKFYERRRGPVRGYRLLVPEESEPEEVTLKEAKRRIVRHFMEPSAQQRIEVKGALTNVPDAASILAGRVGIEREVAVEALETFQGQGKIKMKRQKKEDWIDLIQWL